MTDIEKLHKFTKPVKFRHIKMIKQWCKDISSVIKYYFFNILYKLNILKRYNYRDMWEEVYPVPDHKPEFITTMLVQGNVRLRYSIQTIIESDYFYTEKNGVKKILYIVTDERTKKLFIEASLEKIMLRISNSWYDIDKFPAIRIYDPAPFNFSSPYNPTDKFKYKSITYDTQRLKSMHTRYIIGVDIDYDGVSPAIVNFYKEMALKSFCKELQKISLKDLEM